MRRVLIAAVGSLAAIAPGTAAADVLVHVSTVHDELTQNGQCSLREAMTYAEGQAEPDCGPGVPSGVVTLSLPADCFHIYRGVGLSLAANSPVTMVTIRGAGTGPPGCGGGGTVIDAERAGSALSVGPSTLVAVSAITLTGGSPCGGFSGCPGGGVYNAGHLSLNDVTVTGNVADPGDDQPTPGTGAPGGQGGYGGGIYNVGALTVTDSVISGNAAGSGGAGADGLGNGGGTGGAGGNGGGIYNNGGTVALISSTVSGNTAGAGGIGGLGDPSAGPAGTGGDGGSGGNGGGIVSVPGLSGTGTISLANVTVAGNAAGPGGSGAQGSSPGASGPGGVGGGVAATSAGSLTNVTITANSGGGLGDGLLGVGGIVTEYGSVIADNGSGAGAQNCAGVIANVGANVTYPAQSASSCPGVVADPKLGPLGLHGGPVPTIAPGAASAAIDAEPTGGACPATDARGVARPQGSACDAGAYEHAPPGLANMVATGTGTAGASVSVDVAPHAQDTGVVVRYGISAAYGSTSQPVDAGSSNGVVHLSVPLAGLAPETTYHVEIVATNADGTASSADGTVTTTGSGAGGGGSVAPVVTNVRESAARWLAGRARATLARRRSLPVGTTFSLALNETAKLTLTFTRTLPGRLVKRRCVATSRRNRKRPRCTRTVVAGQLAFSAHAGLNRIAFSGSLSRRARLRPGAYTVTIVAVNAAGQSSSPRRLRFTIVAP